jgi:predicted permease
MSLWKRFQAQSKVRSETDAELQFHLRRQTELNQAQGMSPEEARRQALIAFGGIEQTREAVARQRGLEFIESTWMDSRYALRMLRKTPGFTVVSVVILALGIGANAAIFSAVNAILFARWPVARQEQLVMAKEMKPDDTGWLVSVPNFEDYRRQQTSFQELSLWMTKSVNLTGQERPDRLIGGFVSANYFDMLGVKASMGRTFLSGEDQPGAPPVAVITYGTWQTRFGADPRMLGRKLILNSEPYTVVGILPRDFSLPLSSEDVFVAAQRDADYERNRKIRSFLILGRVQDGVSRSKAVADLNTIARRLASDYPLENAGIHVELVGLPELTTSRVRTPLLVLAGAVALVLLIVCANIANLLLARGASRQREIAVRAALGAARVRLLRQFLCESMVLALSGGALGILLAQFLLKILEKIAPFTVSISSTAGLDLRVLLFTAAISMLAGLLFGMAPALQFSRLNLSPALARGDRAVGQRSRSRLRSGFVVVQVAISVVLVVSAALLVKSFQALINADPGFLPGQLLTMEYRLPPTKYQTPEAQLSFHRRMLTRVQQVPGVTSAALIQALPFSGNWARGSFILPGQPASDRPNGVTALYNAITPEYFSTIGIPLFAGRFFTAHDDERSPAVAIINRTFAERFFPGLDPVGQQLTGSDADPLAFAAEHRITKSVRIIGVVGSAKQRSVREELEPQVYFPYAQVTGTFGTLVIRTAVDPMGLAESVRQAVWSVDQDQPVWKIRTVDSLIERDTAADRFAMLLMTALGGLALLLSALGTYGMLNNTVMQRTRELGIRMALGAPAACVLRLVLQQGLTLLAFGGALGAAGAVLSARLLRSLLYAVKPGDIPAFALGLSVIVLMGLLASYVPARRATGVDPMVALREE